MLPAREGAATRLSNPQTAAARSYAVKYLRNLPMGADPLVLFHVYCVVLARYFDPSPHLG